MTSPADGVVCDTPAVLAVALQAYVAIDTDGRVMAWNPAAETTFGYPGAGVRPPVDDLIIPRAVPGGAPRRPRPARRR